MASLTARFHEHDVSAPPIRLEHVWVRHEGTIALEDVHLEIPPGEQVAIVGPNGAGKTTLIQVIAGTLEPTEGRVEIFGHGPRGHVCIAYVPQRSQVDWNFPVSVDEVVMMGRIRKIGLFRWPTSKDWQFVREALDRVGMRHAAGRQIGELSGGQQQRVFLAQALAQEAEVILLDEPLTGLDAPSLAAILQILQELRALGVTILIATHDLGLAAEHFDRILLLNRRVIAYGSPDAVLASETLLQAYGPQVHRLSYEEGALLVTDTCCDGEEQPRDV